MIITIASGKGGTGKTTVATNLALTLADSPPQASTAARQVTLADCDVEAPNSGLFLNPETEHEEEVAIQIPEIDEDLCTHCGQCAKACQYNALAVIKDRVLVFQDLCHGCGSCTLVCPEGAIREVPKPVGVVQYGQAGPIRFIQGLLNVGSPLAVPIIRKVKSLALEGNGDDGDHVVIFDSPPGTSCPVVETLHGADYALMVTEPTPFGLHDLQIAVQVARGELGLPVGVVINRDGIGDDRVARYCEQEGIPIVMRIPHDRRIAVAYSDGVPIVKALPEYRERFMTLYTDIVKEQSR